MCLRIVRNVLRYLRPGAHGAHRCQNDIEQLGQFVELVFAQESSAAGDAWVCIDGQLRPLRCTSAAVHRSELVGPEGLAMLAYADLPEEDWSGRVELESGLASVPTRRVRRQLQKASISSSMANSWFARWLSGNAPRFVSSSTGLQKRGSYRIGIVTFWVRSSG